MKHLKIFVFSALTLVSVVVIRCIQRMALTDLKTGFFLDGMESVGTALTVFSVVMIAVSSLLVFASKREELDPIPTPSVFLGATAIFAGIAHFVELFYGTGVMSGVPPFLMGLRVTTIFASGVVLVYFGIAITAKKNPHFGLSIILVLTGVARLMTTFISFTGMSNISENMYDVLMLVMTLTFMLVFGKSVCGLPRSRTYRKLLLSGIAAVLFTAASALPTVIGSIFFGGDMGHKPIDSPITGIFVALFIAAYLLDVCKRGKRA